MSLFDSWIMVKDTPKEALWDFFGLEKMDASEAWSARYGYVDLPDGWSVIWADMDRLHDRDQLAAASRLNFALRLSANSLTMLSSSLTAARRGKIIWEVGISEDRIALKGSSPIKKRYTHELLKDFDGPFGDRHDLAPALAKSLSGFDIFDFRKDMKPLRMKAGSELPSSPSTRLKRSLGHMVEWAVVGWWDFCKWIADRCGISWLFERGGPFGILAAIFLFVPLLIFPLFPAAWIFGVAVRALGRIFN